MRSRSDGRTKKRSKVVLMRDGPRAVRDLIKLRLRGKRGRLRESEPQTNMAGCSSMKTRYWWFVARRKLALRLLAAKS